MESLADRERLLVHESFQIVEAIVGAYRKRVDYSQARFLTLAYALNQYQYGILLCIQADEDSGLALSLEEIGGWKNVLEQIRLDNWGPARLRLQEDARGFMSSGDMEGDNMGTAFFNLAQSLAK